MFESANTYTDWAFSSSARSVSSCGASIISVRLSDSDYHSYSNSASSGSGGFAGGGLFGGRSSGGAFGAYSGTGSFVDMHKASITFGEMINTDKAVIAYEEERPKDDNALGELDDAFASPVGDMILPMLLMVGVYAVVRWFKNWKKKLTVKRLFCIK